MLILWLKWLVLGGGPADEAIGDDGGGGPAELQRARRGDNREKGKKSSRLALFL
jgi:hypothetical protein